MVDIFRDGKRDRVCFDDLEKAKTHCLLLSRKINNEGTDALSLSPDQRRDAAKALTLLNGKASLVEASKFWNRHNAVGEGVTVKDLGERFLKSLRAAGCRETTLRERQHKIGRLVKDLGERPACSITKDTLVDWLDSMKLVGVTRDGYRRCYRAMFEYALREKVVEYNAAAALPAFTADEILPVPFTVQSVQSVMSAAEQYAPLMVLTLAVQFFGGLRPGEAKGLMWEQIDFKEKLIRVIPETSKVRRSRIVDMNPALITWLLMYRKPTGPIGVTTQNQFDYYMTRKEYDRKKGLLAVAGVEWIQDGPRKTFASMHYATHQDAGKLAAILGHTGGQDVLFRHYRGLAKKTEATQFWKIRPANSEGNIIQLKEATA